jgi:hypothetical protein
MSSNRSEYFPSHLCLYIHIMIERVSPASLIWIIRRPYRPVLLILLNCHVPSINYKFSQQNLLKTFLNLPRKYSLENSCTWKCCEVEQSDVSQCHLLGGRNVSTWLHRRSRTVEVETFGANLGFCFFQKWNDGWKSDGGRRPRDSNGVGMWVLHKATSPFFSSLSVKPFSSSPFNHTTT